MATMSISNTKNVTIVCPKCKMEGVYIAYEYYSIKPKKVIEGHIVLSDICKHCGGKIQQDFPLNDIHVKKKSIY